MCDSSSRHIFYCKLLKDYRCTIYWLNKTDICGTPQRRRSRKATQLIFSAVVFAVLLQCYCLICSEICNRHIMVPVCPEASSVVSRDLPQKIITLTGIDLYELSHWYCDIGCIVRLWKINHKQMHHLLNASSQKYLFNYKVAHSSLNLFAEFVIM